MKPKTITFRFYKADGYEFPSKGTLVKSSTILFDTTEQLHKDFNDFRKAWDEYFLEAETDGYILSSSHTYKQELENEKERIKTSAVIG